MPVIEVRDEDGNLVQAYEIIVDDDGMLITNEHLFEMAKQNLIEDELVSEDQVNKMTFSVAGQSEPA